MLNLCDRVRWFNLPPREYYWVNVLLLWSSFRMLAWDESLNKLSRNFVFCCFGSELIRESTYVETPIHVIMFSRRATRAQLYALSANLHHTPTGQLSGDVATRIDPDRIRSCGYPVEAGLLFKYV